MTERSEEPRARRRGMRIVVAVALVLVIAAGVTTLLLRTPNDARVVRPRVTVGEFRYGITDASLAPIAEMIPDWITRALVEVGTLDVVDGRYPGTVDDSVRFESRTVGDLGRETGAATVVTGNYCRRGDSLEIEGLLVDPATGAVLQALAPVRTPIEAPLLGIDELKRRVLSALTKTTADSLAVSSTAVPPGYVAYGEFLDGLDAYDREEWDAALRHFRRAQMLDPKFLQPRLTSAFVFAEMPATTASGDKADSVLRQVNTRREQIGPLDRATLDWLNATRRGDRMGALEHMRRAADLWPDRFLYAVGHEAYRVNRPREAVDAFARMDPQHGFLRGTDAYYADYTAALHLLGHDSEALRVAIAGRRQYPDRVATLFNETVVRSALGEGEKVVALLDESLAMREDRERANATVGEMMLEAGYEMKAHGHARAALGILDRAAEWFARQPELVRVTPDTRKTLMAIDFARGRDVQAEGECRDMLNRRPSDTYTRWCLGMLAARRGQRPVADSLIDVLERMSGGRLPPVRRLYQAEIAAALGDRERAVMLLRKGFASGLPFGVEHHANPFLQSLVGFQPFDDLIKPKG